MKKIFLQRVLQVLCPGVSPGVLQYDYLWKQQVANLHRVASSQAGVSSRGCWCACEQLPWRGVTSLPSPAVSLTGWVAAAADSTQRFLWKKLCCISRKAEEKGFSSCSLKDKWLGTLHVCSPILTEVLTGLNYHNWNVSGHPNQWLAGRGLLSAAASGLLRWWVRENVLHVVGFKGKKFVADSVFTFYIYNTIYYCCCLRHAFRSAMGFLTKEKASFSWWF